MLNEEDDLWEVTVGFVRSWDKPQTEFMPTLRDLNPRRYYKIIQIDNKTGNVKSIKIRELQNA